MKKENVLKALGEMSIGTTGSKWGVIVSCHGEDTFEIGTWGNDDNCASMDQTAKNLMYLVASQNR